MTNELYHHGVKGQRWGFRRYQNEDGSLTAAGKKRYSDNSTSSSESASTHKKVSEMTDEELRAKLNRINMEDQYAAAMAKRDTKKISRAQKVAADLAEQAVRKIATTGIEKLVNYAFNKQEKDTITKYDVSDLSKVGDKALKAMLNRASTEAALKKFQSS
jgi:hypothetical protein